MFGHFTTLYMKLLKSAIKNSCLTPGEICSVMQKQQHNVQKIMHSQQKLDQTNVSERWSWYFHGLYLISCALRRNTVFHLVIVIQ